MAAAPAYGTLEDGTAEQPAAERVSYSGKRWHLLLTFSVCAIVGVATASQLPRLVRMDAIPLRQEGSTSLKGTELQKCSPSGQEPTGWTRSGACAWDPTDTGYHEVCVKMSSEFLETSAAQDGNDLSSVVDNGGYWCICAWAWAAAVQRDSSGYEGLELQCEKSNGMLRNVYKSAIEDGGSMSGPTGISYEAQGALDAVNDVCGSGQASVLAAARGLAV